MGPAAAAAAAAAATAGGAAGGTAGAGEPQNAHETAATQLLHQAPSRESLAAGAVAALATSQSVAALSLNGILQGVTHWPAAYTAAPGHTAATIS